MVMFVFYILSTDGYTAQAVPFVFTLSLHVAVNSRCMCVKETAWVWSQKRTGGEGQGIEIPLK